MKENKGEKRGDEVRRRGRTGRSVGRKEELVVKISGTGK